MSRPGGQANDNANYQPQSIRVSVKGQDGSEIVFKIGRKMKLSKLMHKYCGKKQLDYQAARFILEGHRVLGKHTADKLKLEDGAEIYCMFHHQTGGCLYIVPTTP